MLTRRTARSHVIWHGLEQGRVCLAMGILGGHDPGASLTTPALAVRPAASCPQGKTRGQGVGGGWCVWECVWQVEWKEGRMVLLLVRAAFTTCEGGSRTQEGLPSRGTSGSGGRVVLSLHTRVSDYVSSSLSRHLSDSGFGGSTGGEEASVRRVW